MPDIDLSTLTPRDQDPADSLVVMKEGSPDEMGLVPRGRFQSAQIVTAAPATDQANWSPAGFNVATSFIKAQPTTNCFLTGLVAGAADRVVTIWNDSDFVICIERESGASTAANRIRAISLGSVWLLPHETVQLRYSATLSRWLVMDQSRDVFASFLRGSLFLPSTTSGIEAIGRGALSTTATVSTTGAAASPANDMEEYGFFQITNSTAAGTSSVRHASSYYFRGNTANRQGFFHSGLVRFNALGATGALRAGMTTSVAGIASLSAVITNCLLLGVDAGQTTLRLFRGDAAAGTPVDLGANFPAPSATAVYEYCFFCPPNAAIARYMVRRLDSRFVVEGTFTTSIPSNTANLGHRIEVFVGATAAANTMQAGHLLTVGL